MIPPGRSMDQETLLDRWLTLHGFQWSPALRESLLEQLRDAAPMAQQTSRSELMRHAVQRGGRPMDVAALPAPVGGQTPTEPPQKETVTLFSCRVCLFTLSERNHLDPWRRGTHRNAHGLPTSNDGILWCPFCIDETLVERQMTFTPAPTYGLVDE